MKHIDTLKALLLAVAVASISACATQQKEPVKEAPQAEAPAPEPTAAPAAAAPAPVAAKSSKDNYEVSRGDNLWNIASQSRIYGNPYQWPLIYKANSGKIKDADLIYPGQNFDISRAASAAEVDAAVRHAKTRGAWSIGAVEASDKDYLAR
jgi:nucleoid-associated protein YgaU